MYYDPESHHRRSIRLPGYDYRQPGAYFVTLCVHDKSWLFGLIKDGVMVLSEFGIVVDIYWRRMLQHNTRIALPARVVMPNHMHGIVVIKEGEAFQKYGHSGADNSESQYAGISNHHMGNAPPLRNAPSGSLGAIIGNFKSVTTRILNQMRNTPKGKVWQRNYYEHIIRDEEEYSRIIEYIETNPSLWEKDAYY